MATQSKSGLFAKYGNKLEVSVQTHAGDQTEFGFLELPGGVQGVARLTECYFKEYKDGPYKGEYFFRAAGAVVTPEEYKDYTTSIMIPVCDTRNAEGKITPQDEHVKNILNEMRKLAGDDFTEGAGAADLEDLAASLVQAAPYFRYSTTYGKPNPKYPNPRVFQNWHGSKGLENFSVDTSPEVKDNSDPPINRIKEVPAKEVPAKEPAPAPTPIPPQKKASAQTNGSHAEPPVTAPPRRGRPPKNQPAPPPPAAPEPVSEEPDLDDLVQRAKDNDEEARMKLADLAVKAGNDEDLVTNAETWEEVADMIRNASQEPVTVRVEEGDMYPYSPTDKSGKKLAAVNCEVTEVSSDGLSVTLKDSATGRVYRNVPVSEIAG